MRRPLRGGMVGPRRPRPGGANAACGSLVWQVRDGVSFRLADGLPARDCWLGATPAEGGMAVHIPNPPGAIPGTEKGGSLPSTAASAHASRPPQRLWRKRKADSNLRYRWCVTSDRGFRAQRPRCHMRHSGSPTAPAPQRSNPASGETARTPNRVAVDRPCWTHGSEQIPHLDEPVEAALNAARVPVPAASSMPRMAFSTRTISRRAARAVPGGWMGRGAVSALVQFPRIVRARSSCLRAHATPTTSTDKPCSLSASQRLRCRSRHERSAVGNYADGLTK